MKGLRGNGWVNNKMWISLNNVEEWIIMEWTHTGNKLVFEAQNFKIRKKIIFVYS